MMNVNPYQTLGVAASATQQEIKSAFRRAAKEHHPDRGGDANIFDAVTEAYNLLKDPERRAQYDETGQTQTNTRSKGVEALKVLSNVFMRVVEEMPAERVCKDDVAEMMKDIFPSMIQQIKEKQRCLESDKAKWETIRGRLAKKGADFPDVLANVIDGEIRAIESSLREASWQLDVHIRAEELAKDYVYRVDETEKELFFHQLQHKKKHVKQVMEI